MAELRRPLDRRVIAGVCSGIAERFGWSTGLVRILTVASILLPGPQVIAYLVCWVVIPSEKRGIARATPAPARDSAPREGFGAS